MAAATDTILGQIVLSGDLYGFGETPQLAATGVTPGKYVLSQLMVDSKGRVVFARQPTWEQLEPSFVTATVAEPGIFSINPIQSGLTMTGDVLSANTVSVGTFGTAKIGAGIVLDVDGNAKLNLPYATTTDFGILKLGSGIRRIFAGTADELIYRDGFRTYSSTLASDEYGMVRVTANTNSTGSALRMDAGVLRFNTTPSATRDGVSKINLDANNFGLFVSNFSDPQIDMFQAGNFGWGWLANSSFAGGSGLTIASDGTLSWTGAGSYPIATASVLGRIKIGGGLVMAEDGSASLTNLAPATTSTTGTVKIDAGFNVSSGVISTKLASITEEGVYQLTNSFATSAVTDIQDYVGLRLHRASSGEAGAVRAGSDTDITVTLGEIALGANIPRKNEANTFSATQATALFESTLNGPTFTPEGAESNVQVWTNAFGAVTIQALDGVVNGMVMQVILKKNNNSHSFTFSSAYKLNSTLNTFTTSQALMLSLICLSSSEILVVQGDIINL